MTSADEIDELYALPLGEFTTARNDLARALRKDDRREEADEVAALRKPSLPAWLVNQLARSKRADVHALVKAAEAIKAGDVDGDQRFREAVDGLVRAARKLLSTTGRRTSDSVFHEVATTLRASAAVAPAELVAGRLVEARETTGFDVLAGPAARPARARAAKAKAETPTVDRAALDAARRALTGARDEARALRRRLVAAEREALRAQEALDAAETRVAEAERSVDSLRATR